MTKTAPPPRQKYMVPPLPVYRFTVDQYHKLIRIGILTDDEDVELIEGWIVPKMSPNPRHDVCLDQTQEILRKALPPEWRVRIRSAIATDHSEPEPDLAIVPGPASRYLSHHPRPNDVATIIEVSEKSLSFDRDVKGVVYAAAGIPAYWVINLVDRLVEVYTDPTGPADNPTYRHRTDFGANQSATLELRAQELVTVTVNDLLP